MFWGFLSCFSWKFSLTCKLRPKRSQKMLLQSWNILQRASTSRLCSVKLLRMWSILLKIFWIKKLCYPFPVWWIENSVTSSKCQPCLFCAPSNSFEVRSIVLFFKPSCVKPSVKCVNDSEKYFTFDQIRPICMSFKMVGHVHVCESESLEEWGC